MRYEEFARLPAPVGNLGAGLQTGDSGSPIRDGISQTEQLLSEVHESIDALEKRLDTVTTPQPPTPVTQSNVAKNGPVQSHLNGRVSILNEGFTHAVSRLRDICRRVEV